ncbi:MAG TPA: enoyl-CoA hydratase/isomerase family protein [Solirubrobacteraceae bacterium]|nr:enoyl-CoA hydratase/isomerase family protein [Solirubrobacteraceae bacterium]
MPESEPDPPLRTERLGDGVGAFWLDRPHKRNALDAALVEALIDAFSAEPWRAVVLGTTDTRAFCGGADLSLADAARARVSLRLYDLYRLMIALPAPIVAAVQGPAVGGGAQLAIAADLRIGDARAVFRFPGPGHGLAVGAWGLPSLVGRGRAIDLCLTSRDVDADEALRIGLLDRVVDDAPAAARELAEQFAGLDAGAVGRVKRVVRGAAGLDAALAREAAGNASWEGAIP